VATTGVPVLSLDFLTSNTLDPRITFTRSTTATFVGSNGLIQTAAINAPRFDYDPATLAAKGLLIEEQRTNLLLYSQQFDDASWGKFAGAVTANTTVSPDGTTNADLFTISSTVGSLFRSVSVTNAQVYTGSVYFKAGTTSTTRLKIEATANIYEVAFNLSTGTTSPVGGTGSATITAVGNGWYRCTATATATATGTGSFSAIATGVAGQNILVWGAQLEAGAFATSYIPTVASQVTRSADVATMTGTNFSEWYNQSEGTMVCNFAIVGSVPSGTGRVWEVSNSVSSGNTITLRQGTVITGADVTVTTGGVVQVDTNSFTTPVNTNLKSAFAWSTASSNLTANGTSVSNSGTLTPPTPNQLLFNAGASKWLRQLVFYPSRLTNAQLQALTA
jgi:hypothetical protein